ncbi:MAG: RsmB/NOP family class I SAM-dependent RNA methyltransferase [Thermoplasmata archaeon]|nr:MAG: RsmB/NOP family class I SAM-dependent RNA methyltransferase [Thermoplasmata archaeon]
MDKKDKIALRILSKWLKKGNMAMRMRNILPYSGLSYRERESVAKLLHNIVRWKRYYDFILEYHSMDKEPNNYIDLARNKIKIDRKIENVIPKEKFVAIRYSFSDYIANLLEEKFPELIEYLNSEPDTTLCVNLIKTTRERVLDILFEEGIRGKSSILETAVITESIARYSYVIRQGLAHVQDEASQLIAKITVSFGMRILDYCCGSGGKTLAMASITRNKAKLYAYDINKDKLLNLKKRMSIYRAKIKILWEKPKKKFEVVLVDAPCSGIGASRRNPEAKYISSCREYQIKQLEILKEASKVVKKNGYLIYAVCTFTPEETVEVSKIFLKKFKEFREVEVNYDMLKELDVGYLTSIPGGDIFYLSVFRRS